MRHDDDLSSAERLAEVARDSANATILASGRKKLQQFHSATSALVTANARGGNERKRDGYER